MSAAVASRGTRVALGIPMRWLATGLRTAAALMEGAAAPAQLLPQRPDEAALYERRAGPEPSAGREDLPDRLHPPAEDRRETGTTSPLPLERNEAEAETILYVLARSPDSAFAFWELARAPCDGPASLSRALRIRAGFAEAGERIVRLAPEARSHYLTGLPEEGWVSVCLGLASATTFQPLTQEIFVQMPPVPT